MDERIKELLEQANINFDKDMNDIDVCLLLPRDLETFAKLIVAECSESVRDVLREEGSTLSYADCDKIQKLMKESLGVE